ncbi:hypothetical protein ACJJTC_015329 [Scirpophaga incertulas]
MIQSNMPVTVDNNTTDKKKVDKVADKEISDMEYMKLLMKKVSGSAQETPINEEQTHKKIRNRPLYTIKITGLPFKCKKRDIKEFFRPLVPYTIRLPLGKEKKLAGFCYVGFRTEKELKKALNKNKLFIANRQIHIQKYEDKTKIAAEEKEKNTQKQRQEKAVSEESIGESGSIFVRNLPYVISEEELTQLFEKYGPIAEMNMPIDPVLRQPKGFATVTFVIPENAVKAYTDLDGSIFSGRMLHLLPAKTKNKEDDDDVGLSFKEKKAKKLKAQAKSSHNWNTLFLGANAVADVVASNYNTTKQQLLTDKNKDTSAAVRMALGETQLVAETKEFLESNGVYLDAFNKPGQRRSKTCILVKNLPANTSKNEVKPLFENFGHLSRFLMPKHGIAALVDFIEPFEAKKAYYKLIYSKFKTTPLYLEWAPENIFVKPPQPDAEKDNVETNETEHEEDIQPLSSSDKEVKEPTKIETEEDLGDPESDTTLFVKNINFRTTEAELKAHFSTVGKVYNVTIARKKDPKKSGQMLSMGYGFVQFYTKQETNEALKRLQYSTLDEKTLELKRSDRGNANEIQTSRKTSKDTAQNGTKILVRNVPFQANSKELHEIFRAFGEIKSLRLPKKLTPGSEQHRGFAFVDYYSKSDAKTALTALCYSTHLYGRRLVLEWAEQTDENEDVNVIRKRTAESFYSKTPGGKKSRKGAVDVDTFVEGLGTAFIRQG